MKFSWKEGKYFDLWAFIHFLSGSTIGTFFLLGTISRLTAYVLAILLIVGWEIFEIVFKIKEHQENKLFDIILGMIGFMAGYELLAQSVLSAIVIKNIFLSELIILLLMSFAGWFNYKKYGRGI